MRQAVLLLAHGAPERLEDIESYLQHVRGRPPAATVVSEVRARYAAIGGASPLAACTRRQAESLQRRLGLPVYVGMRNWHPFIHETMQKVQTDEIERLVAICMAPQYSEMSVGFYIRRTEESALAQGAAVKIVWTRSFHQHPLLIHAFAEKLAPLSEGREVLFTAHSLPAKVLEGGDPYDAEARATAAAVAANLGLARWDFAYQSQGMTGEPWLGPTVESRLDCYAQQRIREVVLHPIGFVCDHVEVLYDVDILYQRYAAQRGIRLVRPETLNDSPTFIAALADLASRCLE